MAHENLAGRAVAGYRLLERVGEGGTATVYRADHDVHGTCAVKTLRERLRNDPTAVKRFLREAGYGSRVRHPHVVRTYDYGDQDGIYYLALEWANGTSLADFAAAEGGLPPAGVANIVAQLAGALSAAHAAIKQAKATANGYIDQVDATDNQAFTIASGMATGSCSGQGPGSPGSLVPHIH